MPFRATAAVQHHRLPQSAESIHLYKMSSGAFSKAEILTLIHKQLPLSVCFRFRTAVLPNISLSCLAREKKKRARLPFLLRNKGKHKGRDDEAGPPKSPEEATEKKE